MIDLSSFSNLELPGGFVVTGVTEIESELIDAIGRPALAKTTINGSRISIVLAAGMDDAEKSISIYHEMLEGLAVATSDPPPMIIEFNEADFEAAAITAHVTMGFADTDKVIRFLKTRILMPAMPTFTTEMVKLRTGLRLIRVGDPLTDTWLERPLNPDFPIIEQQRLLQQALATALQVEARSSAA